MEDNKYIKSKIYKLHCILENDDEPFIYYGSTIEHYLSTRLSKHKYNYKCYLNDNFDFITSFKLFEKYGINNVIITLVELFPCNSKDELYSRERYYIESNNCVNKIIPTRTNKEYKEHFNDIYEDYNKKYYEKNKIELSDKGKIKYICDCGANLRLSDKARHIKTNKHLKKIN